MIPSGEMAAFIVERGYGSVVITNSQAHRHLSGKLPPSTRLIYDFFAPKLLEKHYENPSEQVGLEAQKIRALAASSLVIVNGAKKLPYVRDLMSRAACQADALMVPMCLDLPRKAADRSGQRLRVLIAGYSHAWDRSSTSLLGQLVKGLPRILYHVSSPRHWGTPDPGEAIELPKAPNLHAHGTMVFDEFVRMLHQVDLVVDLFERNPERELAMVTRTVVAMCAGVPVIHPSFTEVGPLVASTGAGWTYDDPAEIAGLLARIEVDAEAVEAATSAARHAARTLFAPDAATRPLAEALR